MGAFRSPLRWATSDRGTFHSAVQTAFLKAEGASDGSGPLRSAGGWGGTLFPWCRCPPPEEVTAVWGRAGGFAFLTPPPHRCAGTLPLPRPGLACGRTHGDSHAAQAPEPLGLPCPPGRQPRPLSTHDPSAGFTQTFI